MHAGGAQHAIGKLSMRATSLFRPHPNRRFKQRVMTPQNGESPNRDNFGTPPWESQDKSHLDVSAAERRREYYMGEDGGFPQVRAMVSLVSPELLVACPSTKGAPEGELTNLLVGLMQVRVSK
jgi:hypothetical protein